MEGKKTRVCEFGPFRFYPDQKQLFRKDQRLEVDRKALSVLAILVENKGQLVTKGRLLKEVWGDVSVEEGNVGVQVARIRKVLGDEKKQEYLETIHGEGYRFIANVHEKREELYPEEHENVRFLSLAFLSFLVLTAVAAWMWRENRRNIADRGSTLSTASADPQAESRYEQGLKHEAEGDDEQALAELDEATAIDKGFADAYLRAAFVSNQIGEEDQALKYLNQAKNCGGIRSEHQRLQIDTLEAELSEDYQQAIQKYRLLVEAYPTDIASQYYFADFAMQRRSGFGDAGDALGRCLPDDPANPYCNFDRMMLYVMTNDFDKAIALYDSTLHRVHYPWFDEPFGEALYGKGNLGKAREVLGSLSHQTRSHKTSFIRGREWLADIDFFQGKAADGTGEIKVLFPSDTQYGVSTHYLYLAMVNALLLNPIGARKMAQKAVSNLDDKDTRVRAVAILACSEDPQETDQLLRSANGQAINDLLSGTKTLIGGCKALGGGDYRSAVRDLKASNDLDDDLYTEFFLAKAYIAARQWENAKSTLQDLEGSKGRTMADQSYPSVIWPLAHYYLAVAYEESGETEQAVSYYLKFLNIWKDADANLKTIIDAKKRLARLRHTAPRSAFGKPHAHVTLQNPSVRDYAPTSAASAS